MQHDAIASDIHNISHSALWLCQASLVSSYLRHCQHGLRGANKQQNELQGGEAKKKEI